MNIHDMYNNNTFLYKGFLTKILNASSKYIDEMIIFITLSNITPYYPPFEISHYINIIKENDIRLMTKIKLSDDW